MSDLGYPQTLPREENWSRINTAKRWIVTHCTDAEYSDKYPQNLGGYWSREVTRTSTQYGVSDTQVWQYVPHWATAFQTRLPGNSLGIGVEFAGKSSWSREEWLKHDAMFRRGAKLYVQIARKEGFLSALSVERNLTNSEVAAKRAGVLTHAQHTAVFAGTHTDPGSNFPHDVLWKYIKQELGVGTTPPKGEEDDMDENTGITGADDVKIVPSDGSAPYPASRIKRPLKWWLSWPLQHIGTIEVRLNGFEKDIDALKEQNAELKTMLATALAALPKG